MLASDRDDLWVKMILEGLAEAKQTGNEVLLVPSDDPENYAIPIRVQEEDPSGVQVVCKADGKSVKIITHYDLALDTPTKNDVAVLVDDLQTNFHLYY